MCIRRAFLAAAFFVLGPSSAYQAKGVANLPFAGAARTGGPPRSTLEGPGLARGISRVGGITQRRSVCFLRAQPAQEGPPGRRLVEPGESHCGGPRRFAPRMALDENREKV